MTYALLALVFVAIAVVTGVMLAGRSPRAHWLAVAVAILGLVALTAVFDNVMIGLGLFHYSPDHLLGVRLGLAPIEDFAYPIAGGVLLPGLWVLLVRQRARGRNAEPRERKTRA